METQKNKLPIIIAAIIVVSCLAIFAAGFGGYFIFKNVLNTSSSSVQEIAGADDAAIQENTDTTTPGGQTPNGDTENPGDYDLGVLFNAFWKTRELLHDNFLEQPVDDTVLANGAILGLEQYVESVGLSLDDVQLPSDAPDPTDLGKESGAPNDAIEAFSPFWEVWQKVSYLSLPEEATPTHLMRTALTTMVEALDDPYTNYFDPALTEQWNTDLSGEYQGIGAWVDVDGEYLTIISPIKNTPAEEAGLRSGDQIIAIDGDDMSGVDPNIVLKRVLGEAGTPVVLTILREGETEPFDVTIVRQKITIPYIETDMLEGDIAYIQLLRFYDGGDADFANALKDLLAQNPKGLIVDLRGNPGGYLHIVVNIASEFLDNGIVLVEEFSDGSTEDYPVNTSRGNATDIPLVVLVDGGSASASEIFAGAIQDYDRGTIVGQTTFGKGLVQLPITLPDDQGSVSITIARWLTPNGATIHHQGIEPDVAVEITEDDIANNLDPQLEKALEILTNE
ncbi:S41 family peptidase [bacterium]|nr:S41 family peptidase [bacterium]